MSTNFTLPALLYTTWPDRDSAISVAQILLKRGLIACCNLFPAGTSVYVWQGEVHEDPEIIAVFKTSCDNAARVCDQIKDLHPYDVPAIIRLETTSVGSSADFSAWVEARVLDQN